MNKYLALLFLFLYSSAQAESELMKIKWKIHSEKEGIKIYTPVEYKHKSGLIPIKFKTVIKEKFSKVVTVLADNKRKIEWMPYLKETKTIEVLTPNESIVYYRYRSPWPFNPRDFLIRSIAKFNEKTKKLWVELKSIKKWKGVDENPSYVRGFSHDGYAVVSYKSIDETEIEMAFLNEFGGLIPTFVINVVQEKWPMQFMKNLRKHLTKNNIIIKDKFIIDKKE